VREQRGPFRGVGESERGERSEPRVNVQRDLIRVDWIRLDPSEVNVVSLSVSECNVERVGGCVSSTSSRKLAAAHLQQ